jgi:phage shock protein A
MKKFKELTEEINEAASFSPKQIAQLRKEYDKVKKMDPSSPKYKSMRASIEKLPEKALIALRDAKINFISMLATNTLRRRK